MRVTYYTYKFPLREDYQYWEVTYNKKTGSEGLVKIVADIKPSFRELLDFLKAHNYVNTYDITTNILGQYIAQSQRGKDMGNALVRFCSTQYNFQLSAWGYSFNDAFVGGDTSGSDKAMKKIKKKLRDEYQYPLTEHLVEFLKGNGLLK